VPGRLNLKRITQRQAKWSRLNLKHVAWPGFNGIGKRQGGGAEHMDVHVTRMAEKIIFEMMMLKVCYCVGHVGLTRQKRLLPNLLAVTQNAGGSLNIEGQLANQNFRTKRTRAQF